MATPRTGVLHTSSYYAEENISLQYFHSRPDPQQFAALSYLKAEEQKLYRSLGCDSYEDFITTLREAFSERNIEVLQRFRPTNLTPRLQQFAANRGTLYEKKVNFEFDTNKLIRPFSKAINLNKIINKFGANNVHVDDGTLSIGLTYNTQEIKDMFNTLFHDRQTFAKNKEGKYSENITFMERQITSLLGNGLTIYVTKQDPQGITYSEEFIDTKIPNFPWGVTKTQYEKAVQEKDNVFLSEMGRANEAIKTFICEELCGDATPLLQLAIKRAWMKNFNAAERNPAFFFQGTTGGNYISAVQGSLGEFQTAIIFTYLDQNFSKRTGYASLIGDQLAHGEQLKTDVSIIQNLGIQVKNMNTIEDELGNIQLLRDLKTTIHPKKFAQYLEEPTRFLDFIANYYFNTTFADKNYDVYYSLIRSLGSYLGEIMNFAMGEVTDTICFYFIGGTYLVPASAILEAANELDLRENIEITSSYRGLSDLEYEEMTHTSKRGRISPLYITYWKRPYGNQHDWIPTGRNMQIYNKLIGRDISIRTKFNLFKQIEKYSLFKVR